MFDLGLLHDIGVSSTRTHQHLVSEFDWAGSQQHCITGASLLAGFARWPPWQPVRYHHTQWENCWRSLTSRPVAEQANLIYLVDRVDAMAAPYYQGGELLMHTAPSASRLNSVAAGILPRIWLTPFCGPRRQRPSGCSWSHAALPAYCRHARAAPALHCQHRPAQATGHAVFLHCRCQEPVHRPFAGRGRPVALAGRENGPAHRRCDQLEIAALLHDLGKLRVPDEILEKPAGLDPHERSLINAHSFETYQILRHIHGFEEIACWAAYHHEEPDGHGYPFHLGAASMSVEARILRVADIFQALAQDRPTGPASVRPKCWPPCSSFADKQRIDPAILAVAARYGRCHGGSPAGASHALSPVARLPAPGQGRIIADPDHVSPRPENQQDE
jgi:hypothetical protein